MPRPAKKQINLKMRESLIEALKARAESENDTFTDLITRACEQYLEGESNVKNGQNDRPQTTLAPFEPAQLYECIADQIAPLQKRLVALELELGELSA